MHMQSLWSELRWDVQKFKKKEEEKKKILVVPKKNSDKKTKTTRWTFLYNYSSDQKTGGG